MSILSSESNWIDQRMQQALEARGTKNSRRRLTASAQHQAQETIDFSSNDYLGLSHDPDQKLLVEREYMSAPSDVNLGATGSRLLSGDSPAFHQLEDYLAKIHNRRAALLCNSGYDANLTVVSCLPCDVIVYDEYAHNSLRMGMRLWQSAEPQQQRQTVGFQHNNANDLRKQLARLKQSFPTRKVVVLIESVYSMDGDVAPVREMLDVAEAFGARMIVDEAHGLGVYGRAKRRGSVPGTGVIAAVDAENHPALLCSVNTFGKAAGCHGAVLCFSTLSHKEYIVNYGYPFIYSTALPLHSLTTIRCSYETMTSPKGDLLRTKVFKLVHYFRHRLAPWLETNGRVHLLPSTSPIQALIVPDNHLCTQFFRLVWEASRQRIRLYPVKYPTVPAGMERVRIIIHANNTLKEVDLLVELMVQCLMTMALLPPNSRL